MSACSDILKKGQGVHDKGQLSQQEGRLRNKPVCTQSHKRPQECIAQVPQEERFQERLHRRQVQKLLRKMSVVGPSIWNLRGGRKTMGSEQPRLGRETLFKN